MNELDNLYLYSRLGIEFFGAAMLSIIWYEKQRKTSDHGYGYLALAIWVWVLMGLLKSNNLMPEDGYEERFASMLNNAFLLCALPYLEEAFPKIREKSKLFREPRRWIPIVLGTSLGLSLAFSILWQAGYKDLVKVLEVSISIFTFSTLTIAIFQSFRRRKYGILFEIVVLAIGLLLVLTQLFITYIENKDIYTYTLVLVSHSALMGLLLALAISWVDSKKTDAVLTKKQLEVLEHLCAEPTPTYQQIADNMNLSIETINSHMREVRKKLGISDKKAIIEFAKANGLIDK